MHFVPSACSGNCRIVLEREVPVYICGGRNSDSLRYLAQAITLAIVEPGVRHFKEANAIGPSERDKAC
jgi:hypothetical protein